MNNEEFCALATFCGVGGTLAFLVDGQFAPLITLVVAFAAGAIGGRFGRKLDQKEKAQ